MGKKPTKKWGLFLKNLNKPKPNFGKVKESLARIELKRQVKNWNDEHWELELLRQIKAVGLPTPQRYFKPIPDRDYSTDIAYPATMLLIEVDGGTWMKKSGHSGAGKERDCHKDALALILGYKTLRVTPSQIKSGFAIDCIEKIFRGTK